MKRLEVKQALKIILNPYVTEKTFELIEKENKLVFIVDDNSSKKSIAEAILILYEVDVESVNTVRTISGKKAYVKLAADSSASDLASKLGLV